MFNRRYKCNSGVLADKARIDEGGKLNLPHSCFEELAKMAITYPMMFKVSNPQTGRSSHCGVLEFTAEEGHAVVPYWLMQTLGVDEGGIIQVTNASLPRGSFIRIRPEQKAFIDLSNPKAVLESRMSNFSCLTKGDTIRIHYNSRVYPIEILECKVGEKEVTSISIVEADVKVDFARPLDMPPSPKAAPAPQPQSQGLSFGNTLLDRNDSAKKPEPAPAPQVSSGFIAFGGAGRSLSGKAPAPGSSAAVPGEVRATDSSGRALKPDPAPSEGFKAFSGKGRTLN